MPDTGAPYFLPYPVLSDEADVPKALQALALAEHAAMAASVPRMGRWKSASQTMTTASTWYIVTFDQVDPAPQITEGISYATSGIFTVQRAGLWHITTGAHLQIGSANAFRHSIFVDSTAAGVGTIIALPQYSTLQGGGSTSSNISRSWRFAEGDTFNVQAMGYGGANAVVYGTSTRYTWIEATWLTA